MVPCCLDQEQSLNQGPGHVGLERQGLTGCQGPNVGGVLQNERMQEILRLTQGSDSLQVLRLKQALGEQVNQERVVCLRLFPYGFNPLHVGTSG